MSDELPQGWATARISELCDVPKEKGREGVVPYLEIGNVDIGSKNYTLTDKPSVKGCRVAKKNDVLVSKVRPTRGAIIQIREDKLEVSSAFTVLRNKGALAEKCLWQFLAWNRAYLNYLGENCTGTMYPTTSDEVITDFEMPLAPLAEQRQIVAKLETLLSQVDACQQRLQKLPTLLKRFRQSVLAAACSGRLTADWREGDDGPDDLPRSWELVEFGSLISKGPNNGLYKPQSCYGSGTPIVRIDAFYDGKITNWSELKRLQISKKEREQFALADGDILINRVWELYRRGFDTHHIFSVDEYYWENRPRYYKALDGVRREGEDLTQWLAYCAEGLLLILERVWIRVQKLSAQPGQEKLVLRPKQEQLLDLLRDNRGMTPRELWDALGVSKQGSLDLLRPLIKAGLVKRVGTRKTGQYILA